MTTAGARWSSRRRELLKSRAFALDFFVKITVIIYFGDFRYRDRNILLNLQKKRLKITKKPLTNWAFCDILFISFVWEVIVCRVSLLQVAKWETERSPSRGMTPATFPFPCVLPWGTVSLFAIRQALNMSAS
jgi:hypothetical protein